MSQPTVNITELDGALGIVPETAGRLYAVVGVASSGPTDTPAAFASIPSLKSTYGIGPAVEATAYYIEKYGRPVLFTRSGQTTVGSCTAVVFSGTGTSVITVDGSFDEPDDDFEFYFKVITGGTIGVAGITFQWSLDGGRTLSAVTALGTATDYTFPGSGGVKIDFAAGTLVAGDLATFRGSAPHWNTTEIASALDAMFNSTLQWEIAHVVGPIAATDFDVIDPKFTAAMTKGRYRSWYGNVRIPNIGESESTYATSLSGAFASKVSVHANLCAGAAKIVSSVTSGRIYKRPISFAVAAREASVDEHIDIADVNLGSLPGVSIRDANGNIDEHDESANPGLDDLRFTTLRTWDDYPGVYVNNSRCLSAPGSDFDLYTKRRVLNIAHAALRRYFIKRLSRPILVSTVTGFILESEAQEIEKGALSAMRTVLMAKPKASGIQFTLSRVDNILSTKTLTGEARVIPLAYPKIINLTVGFLNPALQVQRV